MYSSSMPTLNEITILLAAFLDLASTTSTAAVNYTLYNTTKTWNEARAVCESKGQQMLKLDTEAKFENFIVWKHIWMDNGLITEDIWTGLHQHVLTDPQVFNLEWHDCEPLGAWALWHPYEPNFASREKCIRIHHGSSQFRTTPCHFNRHVVCQESAGECAFERFDDQDVVLLTPAAAINVCIEDCQRACLTHTGSGQCVAIVYNSETTSCDPCRIYTRQQVYINDHPEMTSSSGRTLLVKRCIQGNFVSTAVSVATNTDNDPITACPVTIEASSTSIMTSEPIIVLSTCPGSTEDIQLSVSTNTQSKTMYSSYASISEYSQYQSVFTSANIFPETSSVTTALTSSSVMSPETSVMDTEGSSESHFTSTSRMYSEAISVTSASVNSPEISVMETEASSELYYTSTSRVYSGAISVTSGAVNSPEISVMETEASPEVYFTSTSRMYSGAISVTSGSVNSPDISVMETEASPEVYFTSTSRMYSEAISVTSGSVNSPEISVMETEASTELYFTSTSRMFSAAISVTSSSVQTSVIEIEPSKSHLRSTINLSLLPSHKLTPTSLYSSTSSEDFKDSTTHNSYWSLHPLTSIADSTTTGTASTSNVVPLVTLGMTMSESSQITTLLDVVSTAYEGTKSTSTVVTDPLDPETITQVSNLDLDPSIVALSNGSRPPRERHRVCVCMNPPMSMTVDVIGNILDRKKTSSYRRSKNSANDHRVSARTIGASGLAVILLVTALIVCGDLDRMIRAMGRCRKRQAL